MISFGSHKVCAWFHLKSPQCTLYMLSTRHYHRHDFIKTSPRHRKDITSSLRPRRIPDIRLSHARRRITDRLRFSKYLVNCVDVAQNNPPILPYASPNIHSAIYVPEYSLKSVNTSCVCVCVFSCLFGFPGLRPQTYLFYNVHEMYIMHTGELFSKQHD